MPEPYTLATAIAEIENGSFECEAGSIQNSRAWQFIRDSLQWQPIETAPKDGSAILLWISGDTSWSPHCFAPVSICDDGTWWDDSTGDQIEPLKFATHWRPLPEPPATGAAS